jgi:site-specific DNA-methyltransferase (adenine-specific)
MKVSDCLRKFETGGLRRLPEGLPFTDLIEVGRTPQEERQVAEHPSLKPQALLRGLVHAVLPLGKGIVVDPFMGSGSTIAAAEAVGYSSIGIEKDPAYYSVATRSISELGRFTPNETNGNCGGAFAAAKRFKANSHQEGGRIRREADCRSHRPVSGANERF